MTLTILGFRNDSGSQAILGQFSPKSELFISFLLVFFSYFEGGGNTCNSQYHNNKKYMFGKSAIFHLFVQYLKN